MRDSSTSLGADELVERALAWGAFGTAYFACYFLSTALPTPLPWYFPTERRFELGVHVNGIAADFYGRVVLCVVAGLVGFGIARIWARRGTPEAKRLWATRLGMWCLSTLLFTAALYIYLLIGRHAPPAPLPHGYVPR